MPFFVKTKKNKVLATKKQMILVGLGRRIYRIKKSYEINMEMKFVILMESREIIDGDFFILERNC